MLTAIASYYTMWRVSVNSSVAPMDDQRANIKFCVKLRKNATETYNLIPYKCIVVMKRYHVHMFQWHKHFCEEC